MTYVPYVRVRHLHNMVSQLTEVREAGRTLLRYGSEQHDSVRKGGAGAKVQVATVEGVCLQEAHTIHVYVYVWRWSALQDTLIETIHCSQCKTIYVVRLVYYLFNTTCTFDQCSIKACMCLLTR